MSADATPDCHIVRPDASHDGRQGFTYDAGISAQSAGSTGICMHLLTIPPGVRAKAHLHEARETAIYMLRGETGMWHGDRLERHLVLREGELLYIPAGMAHLPVNRTDAPATAVIARTHPNEQESVRLLPELDALVPG